jgi:hypothetical protein
MALIAAAQIFHWLGQKPTWLMVIVNGTAYVLNDLRRFRTAARTASTKGIVEIEAGNLTGALIGIISGAVLVSPVAFT